MNKRGISVTIVLVVLLIGAVFLSLFGFYFNKVQKVEQFYNSPDNDPPILGSIDKDIFICEGEALSYTFLVTDDTKSDLFFDITPKYNDPFFIKKKSIKDSETTEAELFSAVLGKEHVNKQYIETIFATDKQFYDTKETKITVMEVNNAPRIQNIELETIELRGFNRTITKQIEVADKESKSFSYDLIYLSGNQIFEIDENGRIIKTIESYHIGNYEMEVCVTDQPLSNPHSNIGQCKTDGDEKSDCETFQITVTDENSPPTISDFKPTKSEINISSNGTLKFELTKFDPDGTKPETRWYVDNMLEEVDTGSLTDNFIYSFGCKIVGNHKIKAEVTDGILTDSVEWKINLKKVECPEGYGEVACQENWACQDWDICQNAAFSFNQGLLSLKDSQRIEEQCTLEKLGNDICGFQIRDCFDISGCNTTFNKSLELQSCFFILNPSCNDGIKNCHDISCEVGVDCGGPCSNCPTCTDGIKNQGEEKADCGGPCIKLCEVQPGKFEALVKNDVVKNLAFIVLIVAVLVAMFMIYNLLKMKKEFLNINLNISRHNHSKNDTK